MQNIDKFHQKIINAAIIKEQQRAFADANRDFSAKLLRDGAGEFIASMSDGSKFPPFDHRLEDVAVGLVTNKLIPLEVILENGVLKQVSLSRNTRDAEFAHVDFMLTNYDDGAKIVDFNSHHYDEPQFSGDLVHRLMGYLSNQPHVEIAHQGRTYHQDLLINARRPVEQLEKLLQSEHKENIEFISNNIQCFSAIKAQFGPKGLFKDRDVIMKFNDLTMQLLATEGKLNATDLAGLYQFSEDGSIKHFKVMGSIIDLLCKQFDSRFSTVEKLRLQDMGRMIEVMALHAKDPASGMQEIGCRFDVQVANDLNEALGFNNKEMGNRLTKNAAWIDYCTDRFVMERVLDDNYKLTGIDLIKMVAGSRLPLPLPSTDTPSDRKSNVTLYNLPKLLAFIEMVDNVVDDDTIRDEAKRLAVTSQELLTIMKKADAEYDASKVMSYYDKLSPHEKFEQISIFAELGEHSQARKMLATAIKGCAFKSMLDEGEMPAVAAKKLGMESVDAHLLKSAFPVLLKVRFEKPSRDSEQTLG